ncbi:hypothetical protein BSK54_10425 [Paenibacillus odorifer]|uniref:hypothetical protein n=1 Tax=Paenibacillus odorifer TaxID=189426 RepID=UPI00096BF4A2|nr:hypothetical protein [Paenibacillus odorifer]OME02662.1 hypothetical protein BSK54_10425 [Paenibacillus odorifer]
MKREKKAKERPKFDIVFVPVPGDPIETIINAIEPNVNAVLKKHGAFLTIPLRDFIREHAIPHKDGQE